MALTIFALHCLGVSQMIHTCRLGKHYPTQLHSRDAAFPNWGTNLDDGNILCGATATGPYFGDGNDDSDRYTNSRNFWRELSLIHI